MGDPKPGESTETETAVETPASQDDEENTNWGREIRDEIRKMREEPPTWLEGLIHGGTTAQSSDQVTQTGTTTSQPEMETTASATPTAEAKPAPTVEEQPATPAEPTGSETQKRKKTLPF